MRTEKNLCLVRAAALQTLFNVVSQRIALYRLTLATIQIQVNLAEGKHVTHKDHKGAEPADTPAGFRNHVVDSGPFHHTDHEPAHSHTDHGPAHSHTDHGPAHSHTDHGPAHSHTDHGPAHSHTDHEPVHSHTDHKPVHSHSEIEAPVKKSGPNTEHHPKPIHNSTEHSHDGHHEPGHSDH